MGLDTPSWAAKSRVEGNAAKGRSRPSRIAPRIPSSICRPSEYPAPRRMGINKSRGLRAIWNIAYDGGLGLGAAAFGFVLTLLGHQYAFVLTGVLLVTMAAGVPLALRKGEFDGPDIGTNLANAPNGTRGHGISLSQPGAP